MTTTVRLATDDEHVAIGQLTLAAYDAAGTMTGPYRDEIADTGARVASGAEVYVAVDEDGSLLGSVTYVDLGNAHFEAPEVGDCGFRMLAVAPSAQGLGIGRALVQRCIDRAVELGRHRLAIHTMAWMAAAQVMYDRMGFERRPDRDVRFPGGDGLVYQRALTPDAAGRFPAPGPVRDPLPWYEDLWAERDAAVGTT
jgi:GNAT superfamily N-acetyltransferase